MRKNFEAGVSCQYQVRAADALHKTVPLRYSRACRHIRVCHPKLCPKLRSTFSSIKDIPPYPPKSIRPAEQKFHIAKHTCLSPKNEVHLRDLRSRYSYLRAASWCRFSQPRAEHPSRDKHHRPSNRDRKSTHFPRFLSRDSNNVVIISQDGSSSETEIGIAVTLAHCQHNPCEDVSEDLGTIFYAGPYQPQFFNPPNAFGEQYQNFTVNIPSNFPKGPAVFSIPHASLVGVSSCLICFQRFTIKVL